MRKKYVLPFDKDKNYSKFNELVQLIGERYAYVNIYMKELEIESTKTSEIINNVSDSKLRNRNPIHYYISSEFIEDINNTTYPTSIQWNKIPHVYSRYILRYTMDPIYSSTLELHN